MILPLVQIKKYGGKVLADTNLVFSIDPYTYQLTVSGNADRDTLSQIETLLNKGDNAKNIWTHAWICMHDADNEIVNSQANMKKANQYSLWHAQTHFPCKLWDAGEKGLTLSAFEWEKDRKTLIYGQVDYMYGEALYKPEMKEGNPIRLYSLDEITEIFCKLGLRICNSFADFSGKPSSDNDIQLMVYSIRE